MFLLCAPEEQREGAAVRSVIVRAFAIGNERSCFCGRVIGKSLLDKLVASACVCHRVGEWL
jgi:hypothetical protein